MSPKRNEAGFMLSEMLVVCSMMVFVLGAAWLAFTTVTNNIDSISVKSMLANDTSKVLDGISREVRQAQEISDGGGVFATASGNDVSFYSNIDASGGPERIRYFRGTGSPGSSPNCLYRQVDIPTIEVYPYAYAGGVAVPVLRNLSASAAPLFRFYTNDAPAQEVIAPTADSINGISMVGVNIVTTSISQGRTMTDTSATKIKIRAMFDSLN